MEQTPQGQEFAKKMEQAAGARVLPLGELIVPTGKIIACDPLAYPWFESFADTVPPGSYPVSVLIVDAGEERYALARLDIKKTPVSVWKMAVTAEQDVQTLGPGEFFGYPVDAGLGCFADERTFRTFDEFTRTFKRDNPGKNIYNDHFAELFKKNAENPDDPNDPGNWVDFPVPGTDGNVIMFQSGWGDGAYASYWGIDESGEICCLLTDFQVIRDPE